MTKRKKKRLSRAVRKDNSKLRKVCLGYYTCARIFITAKGNATLPVLKVSKHDE